MGHRRVEPTARAAAAVLAGGPDAVLSPDSAAALRGLRRWPAVPDITAPQRTRRPGLIAHRSITLTPADRTTELGSRNPTRSGLEDRFQRWIACHNLPQPETNTFVGGPEADAL